MRIGDQTPLPQPAPAAKAPAPQGAPAPTMAGDSFGSDSAAVNVVTFNVAGGASAFKLEEKLMDTPLFQKLVKGDPDAPIVGCQEMTPALAKKLIEAAEKSGNFEVIWPGSTLMPNWVPTSTLLQGNLLLVPKRYKVQKSESHTFKGRAGQLWDAIKGVFSGEKKLNSLLLAVQKRGWVEATLKDTRTGKTFGVLNTHIAYDPNVRRVSTPQLAEALGKLQAKGPMVVMGDFNIPTPEKMDKPNPSAMEFWKALEPFNLQDAGPQGQNSGTFWSNGKDIDSVLTNGFKSVKSEILSGDKMTLPGRPDAKQVSDHYAEADTIAFE